MTDLSHGACGHVVAPRTVGSARSRKDWYVAQLKPGGFERARINLQRQDFSTFMPLREVAGRRNGRISSSLKPLFPGYLFVRIETYRQRYTTINNTYGVARLVALDGLHPTPVPGGLIEALAAQCDEANLIGAPSDFDVGTSVRVISGPFAGMIADIVSLPDAERVCLLMEMMGQSIRTVVARRNLERFSVSAPVAQPRLS